jgi:hypothetical protein
MLTIINLTPHTIKLNSGKEFPPSGMVARVSAQFSLTTSPELLKEEIYIYSVEYGEIEGLPEPQENVLYIVSAMVLEAGKRIGRNDLMAPASGHPETIRNEQGQIVSVPGFVI